MAAMGAFGLLLVLLVVGDAASYDDYVSDDCNTLISSGRKKSGTFTSPNFPSTYPAETTCRWEFQGTGKERVQIMFEDLDLYYPLDGPEDPYDCDEVDSVKVTVKVGADDRDIGVYCGSKMPPVLMSNDLKIEVTFVSRGGCEHSRCTNRGFKAKYSFVTDFGIDEGQQNDDMVCGFSFRSEVAPNGTFKSPNHPGLYPRNTECHYLFHGNQKERVFINFAFIDVEGIPPACSDDTQSDYLEFSNFNVQLIDRKMNRFCGTKEETKQTVKSDGSFFRVTFKSNDVYDGYGFQAYYQFRQQGPPSCEICNTATDLPHTSAATAFPLPLSSLLLLIASRLLILS